MSRKQDIMEALRDSGIEFPETASLQQLETLLASTVGTGLQAGIVATVDSEVPLPYATPITVVETGQTTSSTSAPQFTTTPQTSMQHIYLAPATSASVQMSQAAPSVQAAPSAQTAQTAPSVQNAQAAAASHKETHVSSKVTDELAALEAQLKILKLIREINSLEEYTMPRQPTAKFVDIEHALSKFSGDDGADIVKWVRDLEHVAEMRYNLDKVKSLRFAQYL